MKNGGSLASPVSSSGLFRDLFQVGSHLLDKDSQGRIAQEPDMKAHSV